MSSIKVNVRSKVRLTSTGQTTFVKKVVLGTPIRSVISSGSTLASLSDTTITSASNNQILVFDSASQKFINSDSATLVNLTVSGDIVPAVDSASSLGTASKKFKNLFLSGDTIRLGTLVLRDSNGGLGVRDTANAPKPIGLRGARQQIRSFFAAGGDLSYNPVTGIFSLDVETVYTKANFDSDLGAALSGGAGITYDSSTDTISITNTGVTPGTYGSASQVPQIVVNPKGQILSVSNVSIAGVTGITFDSSNGALTVSTSAGTSFTDSINLNPFSTTNLSEGSNLYFTSGRADARVNAGFSAKSTTNLSEGNNLYYTTARADSAFDVRFDSSFDERLATKSTSNLSEGSNLYFTTGRADARVNLQTGSNLDLSSKSTSNLSEGTNLYFTTARADSDAKNAISGGTGIGYNSTTGVITSNDGQIVHDNLSGFVADEHVAHSGVSIVAGKGLSGGGTIASSRTIDIDSANVRGMFSGSNGISYTSGTGDIRAPQPLDSAANPTFNQLRGPATFIIDPAAIGDSTGTVRILGNLTVEGATTTINSTTVSIDDKNIQIADSAADSAGLDGGGITWGGSSITNTPKFNYSHSNARFEANRPINATSFIGNVTGNASGTAASVTNAAQTNITSLGTLTGLTSTGDVTIDSAGGFLFDISDKALEFGDNYKATFGNGGDLDIYHDGSNSFIQDDGTGELRLLSSFARIRSVSGTTSATFYPTNSVDLYYNTTKRFETTDSGAKVTGQIVADSATFSGNISAATFTGSGANLTNVNADTLDSVQGSSFVRSDTFDIKTNGDLRFVDNVRATFGSVAGGDLAILHDGSNSAIIDQGTGGLFIRGSSINIDDSSSNDYITATQGGAVTLFHNGSSKLATTSSGAEITGYPLITAGALGTTAGDTLELLDIRATQSNTSKLRVFTERDANGTDWTSAFTRIQQIIDVTEMGYIQFNGQGEGRGMELGTEGDEKFIKMVHNGPVELYNNNIKKFETTSSGASVTGTLAATLSTAAQPNITSLGTLTGLTSTGDVAIDSAGGFLFDVSDKTLKFGENYKISLGSGGHNVDVLDLNNHNIIGVNKLFINDAGNQEGIIFSNIKLFESPNNLTNAGGNFQVTHGDVRRFTVSDSGAEVVGQLVADSATVTNLNYQLISQGTANNSYDKIRVWSSGPYALGMVQDNTFGGLDDYAITFTMSNNDNRGFLFRDNAHSTAQGAMALTTDGELTVAKAARIGYGISDTTSPFDSNGGFALDIFGSLKVDSAVVQDKLFLDSEGNTSRMSLQQVNSFGGDILRIKTSTGTVDIGPANSSYSHFITDRTRFFFNRKIVVDDILSSYNGNLELQKEEVTKLTLSDSGATVTGQLVADSATFTNATISNISNAPIFKAVGGNEGGEINLEKSPNSTIDGGTYNRTVIDMNINKLRFFTNGSARGAHLNLSNMDSNSVGSNEIVTEKTSHTFTKSQTFSNDVLIDSDGGFFFDVSDKKLALGDNYKAIFGNGSDLQIYHDGSNSYIDEGGTGNLYIRAGGNNNISLTDNAVYLYYNGSTKLQTTNTGVSVTGKITSSDSALFDGNGSSGGVSISDGLIDIRTGTGNVSKVKFYCEASNAHFQTLQAAPHSAGSSAVIVLPTASGTLLNTDGSGASLTNLNASQLSSGTVPSARLSLEADDIPNLAASKITSGTFDSARLPAGAFGGAGGGEANQNAFSTIAVAGQSNVVADAATDTVTFVAGSNMTITTNASGDTVTFTSTGGGGGGGGGLDSADVLTVTGTASISGVSGNLTVAGALSATTKSFDIEHPTQNGKRLRYGSLEGPENGVYVRGRIQGINKIKLPDYWTGLVDEETITVNITPIGSEQCLFVEDIQSDEVIIGGGQDIDCFYTVYGERKDVDKLKVEYES